MLKHIAPEEIVNAMKKSPGACAALGLEKIFRNYPKFPSDKPIPRLTIDYYEGLVREIERYAVNGANYAIWNPEEINPKTRLTYLQELTNFVQCFKDNEGDPRKLGSSVYPDYFDLCFRVYWFTFTEKKYLEEHCKFGEIKDKLNKTYEQLEEDFHNITARNWPVEKINIPNHYGDTNLISVIRGYLDLDVIISSIKKGANLNIKDRLAQTALYWAVLHREPEVIRTLLEAGANPNFKYNGETLLVKWVKKFSNEGVPEKINLLLEFNADTNIKDKKGNTALIYAVKHGTPELIKALIKHGANINTPDNMGYTPLMEAILSKKQKIVETLLQLGADTRGALRIAASGPVSYVHLLLRQRPKPDVNEVGPEKRTPLHNAIELGQPETIRLLIQQGAGINAKTNNGITPLIYAIYRTYNPLPIDIFERLIKAGADINSKDKYDQTPLMYAASIVKRPEIADLLLKNGADVNARDNKKQTPLMHAAAVNNPKVANFLLKNGTNIDAQNNEGATALMTAASVGGPEVVELLLKAGANKKMVDNNGKTALDLAKERKGVHQKIRGKIIEMLQSPGLVKRLLTVPPY